MFGHLKSEDFVNLMETSEVSVTWRRHLDLCHRCRTTWEALSAVHDEVTSVDEDIPEPDWAAFRSSVRDRLFERSVQREASMRRRAGWAMRPSAVWALSVMLAVGIPTGAFLWHLQKDHNAEFIGYETPKPGSPAELIEAGTDKTVFDDLMQLTESEQEQLQHLLESALKGSPHVQ
jgi:hypothetical protein